MGYFGLANLRESEETIAGHDKELLSIMCGTDIKAEMYKHNKKDSQCNQNPAKVNGMNGINGKVNGVNGHANGVNGKMNGHSYGHMNGNGNGHVNGSSNGHTERQAA